MSTIIKNKLVDFIKKYNLNKTNETVKVVSENGDLICDFISMDSTNVGYVKMKNVGFPDCELGIYDTSSLLSLLDFLSTDINVEFSYSPSKMIENVTFNDGVNAIKYMTCRPDVPREVPEFDFDNEPNYEVKINIDAEFIGNYTKALSALPESQFFTIISDGKKTELLMNYNNEKSNTAKFKVDVVDNEHFETKDTLIVKTDFINKILLNNRNSTNFVLNISTEGLVKLEVENGDFSAIYITLLTEKNGDN